eukprot:Unigene8972_Nuclearia_a/m.27465 Unigene8972_Nuclearia_a/g.27465  ORF Unigene8972_Nuclearia_a/g.27465 Unigene8972_Nuclearia_a/m.27465 type:complete len:416 (+) Unigene8972_Nuclearia_a:53-1300(+)
MARRVAQRFRGEGINVWSTFTPLAVAHQACNLGQGFPEYAVAPYLKAAVAKAIETDALSQYAPVYGLPRLRRAIAAEYGPRLGGRTIDATTEVLVSQGATEATVAVFMALLDPGDEVVLLEPFYDMYPSSITFPGGVPVYVPLRRTGGAGVTADGASWALDVAELRRAITPNRTKAILLNTPHNPIGKVYSRDELQQIAELAHEFDLVVVSDEVYDHLLYDDAEHVSIASLPGMWERTVTIGSAGKTFSVTGWKVGWVIGPATLVSATVLAHQRIAFCVATPLQEAVAIGFEDAGKHNFFAEQQAQLRSKRQIVLDLLDEFDIPYTRPQGAYFVLFNTDPFKVPAIEGELRDWTVCKTLTKDLGVAAIPPSAFYSEAHATMASNYARFCFCKNDSTLLEAVRRLRERLPAVLADS